ncbi:uncharacterized protein LOC127879067 [Dreissena polymorpha]|uniref:uncharacterized protein LOC127879067 n=1 Tax=Dreissena polymorpha TaxID=45954 RepID=UPI0022653127|nr:uncharacterized protein LOC127879067 [Dreissena polymorpha]XP_052281619.1 uncharacterized protein LOC127879067 [Dreissena polymorpha]
MDHLDFADDISLLSHTHQHMQEKIKNLVDTARSTGLSINPSKTKTMRINATRKAPILLEDRSLEEVDSFVYLGSVVSETRGADEDVKVRIGKAQYAFYMLRNIWRNRRLMLSTKLSLFNSNMKSVLLYGSETWKHTKALDHKLQVFINRCLRNILRIRWPNRISNQDLWKRTRQKPIATTIKD